MSPRTHGTSHEDLEHRYRELRSALDSLLDELEGVDGVDCDAVREEMPAKGGIKPPWERAGYESKEEWLDSQG